MNRLIPELDVCDLERSLRFYVDVLGFQMLYQRPEERFAFLDFEGARFMLEQADGPGRRFRPAPLEPPYGRGINLQIEARDVDALHLRLRGAGFKPWLALEERWYRRDAEEVGNRQFVVADPDGYLLRFFTSLGRRNARQG